MTNVFFGPSVGLMAVRVGSGSGVGVGAGVLSFFQDESSMEKRMAENTKILFVISGF